MFLALSKPFFIQGPYSNLLIILSLPLFQKNLFPDNVNQFRPTSLCNVIYKVISKILVNRLKPLMDQLALLTKMPLSKEGIFRITSSLPMKFLVFSVRKREGSMVMGF